MLAIINVNFWVILIRSFQASRAAAAAARAGNANNNNQPTFEDLTIDDGISELERLVKYAKSSIGLQR